MWCIIPALIFKSSKKASKNGPKNGPKNGAKSEPKTVPFLTPPKTRKTLQNPDFPKISKNKKKPEKQDILDDPKMEPKWSKIGIQNGPIFAHILTHFLSTFEHPFLGTFKIW